MKKLLALLLALLMLCSVTLVACSEEDPADDTGDDWSFDETDDNGDETGDKETNEDGNEDETPDNSYTEIAAEKWYVRYPYKVRNRATSIDSEKYILGTVNYGEEVTVVGVDGKYYVIDFTDENGAKAKGYIYKDFLTKSKGMTELQKFVDADGKEITKEGTVKIDFNGLSLRTTPWNSKGLPEAFANCNLIAGSNETWKIPNGSKVTVIGKTAEVDKNSEVNGYWVKIEAIAAPVKDGDSEVKLTGWCPANFVEFEGNTTDSTSNPSAGEENIPAV